MESVSGGKYVKVEAAFDRMVVFVAMRAVESRLLAIPIATG